MIADGAARRCRRYQLDGDVKKEWDEMRLQLGTHKGIPFDVSQMAGSLNQGRRDALDRRGRRRKRVYG